jgi:hypothetical protein
MHDAREKLAMKEILDYAKRWHMVNGIRPEFEIEIVKALMCELGIEIQTRFVFTLKAMTYNGRYGATQQDTDEVARRAFDEPIVLEG